jgi:hypothetical protein
MALVSVQIVGGLTWLGFEKPDTVYTRQHIDFEVLKCKSSQIAIISQLSTGSHYDRRIIKLDKHSDRKYCTDDSKT